MTDIPEIACIIPTFESLDLVAACLDSVLAQTGIATQIVVTDDSRGDRVRRYIADTERLHGVGAYVEGARTGNPVDNWNHGLARATASARVLIHQDEILLDPRYLRDAVDALDRTGAAAAIGRTVLTGGLRPSRHAAVAAIGRRLPRAERFLPMINWIGPTAAFVFRGDHRFDRDLVQLVDVEFCGRVLKTGAHVVLPGPRVGSRGYHHEQITAAIDPVALALDELDSLAARFPPAIGPFTHVAAKLATRARRWSR